MPEQDEVWGPHDLGYTCHSMAVGRGLTGLCLACSSFIPEAPNFVDIFALDLEKPLESPQVVRQVARLPHCYPPSRVRWLDATGSSSELLVTSGDCLRVFTSSGELRTTLREECNPQACCTPLTSVDVSSGSIAGGAQLASCDVYGICALWDLERATKVQALDLGQPFGDVAYGPGRLLALAGHRGDCFLIDPRQPQEVTILNPRAQVSGPARISWGVHRPDMFAVAWQGQEGALVLYSGSLQNQVPPRVLQPGAASTITSDLQWSFACPELLCCAKEDGAVEVWQFPEGLPAAGVAPAPGFRWESAGRKANCTALATTPEVAGKHFVVLASMPQGGPLDGQKAAATAGSLWIAGLPSSSRSSKRPLHRGIGSAEAPLEGPQTSHPTHCGLEGAARGNAARDGHNASPQGSWSFDGDDGRGLGMSSMASGRHMSTH